ncbi:DUF5313 domain-containing protein [Amycolatopsis sp. OK19-0408]|uniref:DUF5313 domain-containing protein n=1 Tax=Amycolatopsis iheyensis TaxID=2945988 RepID=A0A9X2NFJ5_9PSEU|nr:DUF5313 domain-containing protein [Amycolatopsis iheyensis]MCR6487891.1 DUF5313 domain-containing protein [Amycolatopsis iheyensis]
MDMQRPGPLRWIRYVYGGRLPERYREWVLHDATAKTWLLRFAVRICFEALPWLAGAFALLVAFTPVPVPLLLGGLALSLVLGLFFTLTSADELAEVRLGKHGFPRGTGKKVRAEHGRAATWP